MDWKNEMLKCFRAFGGTVKGFCRPANKVMRFKPAINKHGDLYVSIFVGSSTKRYHALPLEDWATWASEYCDIEV